jgi:hypothetical protein
MSLSVREFKVAGPKGDGRHAYVNKDGAFIGLGVPLLERGAFGQWKARDAAVLDRLFAEAYGIPVELGWRATQLCYVAQALNKGDLALASISLVRAELPPLPSADHARRMAKADGLLVNTIWIGRMNRAFLKVIQPAGNGQRRGKRKGPVVIELL